MIRTRFAPSPTGYLHIGGARTALFNYLLARRHGGQFLLRIEDTDQTRNIAGAEAKLLDDLRWLGLRWDEGPQVGGPYGPYYQSQKLERYQQAAQRLLDEGKAYYAFETREELDALRKAAEAAGGGFLYPRPDPLPTATDAERARAEGRPVVVRFRRPERDVTVRDRILGDVTVKASEIDDFVILKADGWPTYHFAVVIDDEDMQITHVLRGQEHLINTPRHMLLQEALGFRTPEYAHLPIILGAGGAKMSKREKDKAVRDATKAALAAGRLDEQRLVALTGVGDAETLRRWLNKKISLDSEGLERAAAALRVELPEIDIHDFRRSGYLPEVIVNFIALLGWSPPDGREKMTLDEMAEVFSLDRIGKTNARFDREKLMSFNTDALLAAAPERTLVAFKDWLRVNPDSPLAQARGARAPGPRAGETPAPPAGSETPALPKNGETAALPKNGETPALPNGGEAAAPPTTLPDAALLKLIEINKGFRTFRDIETKAGPIFMPDDAFPYDEGAVRKHLLKGPGLDVLRDMKASLAGLADWTAPGLERLVRDYGERRQLGLGKVAQPLRVAVTGTVISPPIFDTLVLLGRDKTLARIDRALAFAADLDQA